MRSRIDFIANRLEGNLAQSGTSITLAWNEWPAGAVRDPVTKVYTGTATERRASMSAFLHFVSASSAVRQFNEIQVGDCIVDLSPTVGLRGLDGLVFLLPTGPNDGAGQPTNEKWTNKPMSSQLSAYWDTMQSGRKLFQTVLLRKST